VKGIILAGGTGSRLLPLTKVTNKHLLPVGDYPMIFHCIKKLKDAEISDIMIVAGPEYAGSFMTLLGSGRDHGCEFTYRIQDTPDGIAGALLLCEKFCGDDKFVVILGDNIFNDSIIDHVSRFKTSTSSCSLLLKKVPDPERYGVAVIEDGKIVNTVEKPKSFISDLCITGIYMYDKNIFEVIRDIKKSDRGELEITEANHIMIKKYESSWSFLDGWWTDAGTLKSYHFANNLVVSENE
jgi:glucose-1-phosphate thymidylyltransferase